MDSSSAASESAPSASASASATSSASLLSSETTTTTTTTKATTISESLIKLCDLSNHEFITPLKAINNNDNHNQFKKSAIFNEVFIIVTIIT